MGKILNGNTVITIQNEEWGTSVFESNEVILSSLNKGFTYTLQAGNCLQSSEPRAFSKDEEPNKVPEPSAHEKKVQEHINVLLDVLKGVETDRLNAAARREYLEAELESKERSNRAALRIAIHHATQAGVSEEEVTRRLRDGHANYVADAYDEVRQHTDLDRSATVGDAYSHEQNTY